jgi:ubiquinone/menaquinone biosynthesis C-methylase UbiE
MSVLMSDTGIKKDLVRRARLGGAKEVLDFGCGTGTLAILVKQSHPHAMVFGLDVDKAVLAAARRKAAAGGFRVHLDSYDGDGFPYADGSFDRVLSSFVFHHLENGRKKAALREIRRVLRPEGEFYLVDFDRSKNPLLRLVFSAVRLLDGRRQTRANASGLLRPMVVAAGFARVEELVRYRTVIGEVTCLVVARR